MENWGGRRSNRCRERKKGKEEVVEDWYKLKKRDKGGGSCRITKGNCEGFLMETERSTLPKKRKRKTPLKRTKRCVDSSEKEEGSWVLCKRGEGGFPHCWEEKASLLGGEIMFLKRGGMITFSGREGLRVGAGGGMKKETACSRYLVKGGKGKSAG